MGSDWDIWFTVVFCAQLNMKKGNGTFEAVLVTGIAARRLARRIDSVRRRT